ncbi:haloacid dehalogenase type II [Blastococcus haudaquaticus]|uniref:2-haloacid dehalogenase n=1 Tax=Blastococcus haudaquaticus TaxID=1938745 RepID=A0A286GP49_9ACTN|nr:haloacid dehalogenase type II [Blastococcus haudaquaticus]SOD97313.1 2-haloacid dehalogenase [Blastococcus haudaquaticus]
MADSPSVVVFDVNETLSDMAPMAQRFADVGAPEHLAKLWFAMVLRDGFALIAAGSQQPFAKLAAGALRTLFSGLDVERNSDAAVDHIMSGFGELPVHADVADGARSLQDAGLRLITLSNGSSQVADQLLTRAGIRDCFDRLLSVEDAPGWKPARGAYEYAAGACGAEPPDMLLVAVHPWDIHGAARTGMQTVWINRTDAPYPDYFTPPTHTVSALTEIVGLLA